MNSKIQWVVFVIEDDEDEDDEEDEFSQVRRTNSKAESEGKRTDGGKGDDKLKVVLRKREIFENDRIYRKYLEERRQRYRRWKKSMVIKTKKKRS